MQNQKSIYKPQYPKLTPSQRQDTVPFEKDGFNESPPHPNNKGICHNAESGDLVNEDKILHNGEGLDPEAFDERSDFTGENLDNL